MSAKSSMSIFELTRRAVFGVMTWRQVRKIDDLRVAFPMPAVSRHGRSAGSAVQRNRRQALVAVLAPRGERAHGDIGSAQRVLRMRSLTRHRRNGGARIDGDHRRYGRGTGAGPVQSSSVSELLPPPVPGVRPRARCALTLPLSRLARVIGAACVTTALEQGSPARRRRDRAPWAAPAPRRCARAVRRARTRRRSFR